MPEDVQFALPGTAAPRRRGGPGRRGVPGRAGGSRGPPGWSPGRSVDLAARWPPCGTTASTSSGPGWPGSAVPAASTGKGVAAHRARASDGVGGRVRTDRVDEFLLDRGFQVLLTAYPEARDALDYRELELHPFYPGAMVQTGGKLVTVADPFRRRWDGLRTALAPVGSLSDKLKVTKLRRRVTSGSLEELFARPRRPPVRLWPPSSFSETIVDRFFRPLFGGVLLDRELGTSSRMFEFVYRMFSSAEPRSTRGMGAIPEQLAGGLAGLPPPTPAGHRRRRRRPDPGRRPTAAGQGGGGRHRQPTASQLLGGEPPAPASVVATCLYFAADRAPVDEPVIVLDGDGQGPVNNLCVPSAVAPTYAHPGPPSSRPPWSSRPGLPKGPDGGPAVLPASSPAGSAPA